MDAIKWLKTEKDSGSFAATEQARENDGNSSDDGLVPLYIRYNKIGYLQQKCTALQYRRI